MRLTERTRPEPRRALVIGTVLSSWNHSLPRGADGLDLHQFLASSHHHLGHLLQANLQFSQGLFRVTVGTVLNTRSLLTAALDQGFTLLLRLLTELQGIVVNPLGLVPALLLQTQTLTTDRFEILKGLLTVGFVLLGVLALDL